MSIIKLQENESAVVSEILSSEKIMGEIVTDDDMQLSLVISNSSAPIIQSNYEILKVKIIEKLESYQKCEVTDLNLAARKKDQRELASLRVNLDNVRKEKKKELEEPIKKCISFLDSQCGELIELVKETEKPLKDGIAVFDEKKKEELREYAKDYFHKAAEEIEDKFREFKVPAECEVLKASKKTIRTAVDAQIEIMLLKQNSEKEKINTINTAIAVQNEKNTIKLSLDSFRFILDSGASLTDILSDIAKRGQDIYDAENRTVEVNILTETLAPQEDKATEAQNIEPIMCIPEEMLSAHLSSQDALPEFSSDAMLRETAIQNERVVCVPEDSIVSMFEVTFKVKGTYNEIKNLSDYIKTNQIQKEILNQIQI